MNRKLLISTLAFAALVVTVCLFVASVLPPPPVPYMAMADNSAEAGPILRLIRWIFHRHDPIPPDPVPPDPVPPDPIPPDPVPPDPVPPTPINGLRVLITGPSPRAVRDESPEGVALLTSRTFRDWTDIACEKVGGLPALRIMAKPVALTVPDFSDLAKAAPDAGCALVAKVPDKEPLVITPLPAFDKAITELSKYADLKLPRGTPVTANPPTFTDAEWASFKGDGKVAEFKGEKRYLTAKPRDKKKHPYGSAPGTVSLAEAGVRVIPRAEWPARLAALKAANAGLVPLLYDKLACSDQASTNYCWANGPANCGATIIYETGRGCYLLSSASVGGPVTGYRNVGGWPADAIAFMAKTGIVRDSLWPNASISSSYANRPEVKADYPKHLVSSTIADLGASGSIFDETVTCVLLGAPVATAHDWWGHAVMAVGLDYSDGVWYLVERNSWGMSYGDQGFFKLREGRGSNQAGPDDAQVILWLGEKAAAKPYVEGVEDIGLRDSIRILRQCRAATANVPLPTTRGEVATYVDKCTPIVTEIVKRELKATFPAEARPYVLDVPVEVEVVAPPIPNASCPDGNCGQPRIRRRR